jgi:hypothetical protein
MDVTCRCSDDSWVVTSVLPAVLLLAVIDAVNPASIPGAIYLAGSLPLHPRQRLFIDQLPRLGCERHM